MEGSCMTLNMYDVSVCACMRACLHLSVRMVMRLSVFFFFFCMDV